MVTGISLKDGSYVDVRQIALVQPDKMDWCRVTLESGIQFYCQDHERIKRALDDYQKELTQE